MKLARDAIQLLVSPADTGGVRKPEMEFVKVLPSEVLTAIAVYAVLRCSVYLWYQSRRQRGDASPDDVPASDTDAGDASAGRRRIASGIHRTENRKRAFVRIGLALATLTLAGLALSSIGGQGAGP